MSISKLKRFWTLLADPDRFFYDDVSREEKVLNYGCGSRKEPHHIGVDISDGACADYVLSAGDPLPFPDATFDLVFSRFVLEHVHDLAYVLAEVSRVLKPGGVLRFCVPHALSIDMFDDPTHCRFFTLRTMNYFVGVSDVHYASKHFSSCTAYLRLTLGWPRLRLVRYPANLLLAGISLLAPNFSEHLLKMPFTTGTLFFELESAS